MAEIEDVATGRRVPLRVEMLLGRSRRCDIVSDHREVSSQHALMRWTSEGWEIRDLGSLNGTFVDEKRLPPGGRQLLAAGARIGLGAAEERLRLLTDTPPHAAAIPLDGGEPILAEHGMIALPPGAEPPEISVYSASGAWIVEEGERARPAASGDVLGGRWRLLLPEEAQSTWEAASAPLSVHDLGLRVRVSRDEEFSQIILLNGAEEIPLEPRAHHYLLLTLARARLRDQAADPSDPAGHGWIYHTDLARMLRTEEAQINLHIFRLRRQVAEAGIADAAEIVERRPGTRQLRVTVARLEVELIGG